MIDQVSWSIALAVLVTAPVLGKLIDAAFHRSYNPILKERLFAWAIRFDELSYVQLIHEDTGRGLGLLERFFGRRRFSWRFASISIIPPLVISTIWIIDAGVVYGEDVFLIIYVALSVLVGQISLLITKQLLKLAKPQLLVLIGILSSDIVAAYLLGPMPFAIPYAFIGDTKSLLDALVVLFTYLFIAGREPGIEPYLLWSMFLIAVLPTCVHMSLVAYDLLQKMIVRPLAKFLSGLLEFLSNEKQPITWALGTIGALPAVFKAWSEVLK